MVDIHLYTSQYGTRRSWDQHLVATLWAGAPTISVADEHYYSMNGISSHVVGAAASEIIDRHKTEVLAIGRAMVIDQLLDELATPPRGDVEWGGGNVLEECAWWRGCLIVRMLHYQVDLATEFPRNELWMMALPPAREGRVVEMRRMVDTSMAP